MPHKPQQTTHLEGQRRGKEEDRVVRKENKREESKMGNVQGVCVLERRVRRRRIRRREKGRRRRLNRAQWQGPKFGLFTQGSRLTFSTDGTDASNFFT